MKLDAAQQSLLLQQAVLKHMTDMANGVDTQTTAMKVAATKNAEAMAKAVKSKLMQLNSDVVGHSVIPDMVNAIISWFQKLASQGGQLASNFVNNFLSGLKSAWGAVVSWLQSALAN